MKKSVILMTALLVTTAGWAGVACAQEASSEEAALDTLEKRASYAIGMNIAQGMKAQDVPVDLDLLIEGLRDAYTEGETRMTPDQVQSTMQEFQQIMVQRQQQRQAEQAEENKQEAEEFFAANKEKEGVQTTESGLQYKVLEEGDGPTPTADDRVSVHYTGTLLDGTKFDSSVDRGQPATFPVGGVIPGWTEILQLMPVGSKYMVWIPAALAYGAQGRPPTIGPSEALAFEVELLGIEEESASEGGEEAGSEGGR